MTKPLSFLKSPPILFAIALVIVVVSLAVADWPLDWRSRFWVWLGTQSGGALETNSTTLRNVGFIVAGLLALVFAYWRSIVADRQEKAAQLQAQTTLSQAETAQRGLLNERYQKGAEMLGSNVLAVQLGGIYALDRLAREHPEEYPLQIMQLFCTFARHPTRNNLVETTGQRLRDDVQAIMEAIGSRGQARIALERRNYYVLDLEGADLSYLALNDPDLSKARLQSASLFGARIVSQDKMADLSDVNFREADLAGALIWGADLSGANLCAANLSSTSFLRSNLTRAHFALGWSSEGGALRPAIDLTQRQLDEAVAYPVNPPYLGRLQDPVTGEPLIWRGMPPPAP